MAIPYNTGPVGVWVSSNHPENAGSGRIYFLGHGERGPRIQIRSRYSPVYTDVGGLVELDSLYAGRDAIVQVTLTRYNMGVLRMCAERDAATPEQAASDGTDASGKVGTLAALEGMSFRLWLNFPHAAKGAMAGTGTSNALPRGYRWLCAYMLSPDAYETGQSSPHKISCVWHCLRKIDIQSVRVTGAGGNPALPLFDRDMTGLPPMD